MMQQDRRKKNTKEVEFFTEYGEANRYKILEVIGKGSYGVVCAAIDTHTGEKVAIKKITNIFEHTSDAIRILREIKLLRLLRHPDIVDIKRIMLPPSKRDFKDIYVVFELMESDLHHVIKANDDLSHEHHRFFLYQMLRALKYMHTANVYHRDLKPKNILANANCKLKICDLGLARVTVSGPALIFLRGLTDVFADLFSISLYCACIFIQYTPAIDIWSIGCIFAEVLTGKPLFPGKSVVHQLDLMTDLLGTPSADTISGVRNEKARKYLTSMRKKDPVSFSEKFPDADPLVLRLLQRLLAFDPKDRPTAEEALSDPYFNGLAKIEREPSCRPISNLEFEFERRRVTKEDIKELIFREILEYHPQLQKDYVAGNDGSNFLYPSASDQFRRQFAYLEENNRNSGPVIPLGRKHVSLPRSAVNSCTIPPKPRQNVSVFDHTQVTEKSATDVRVAEKISGTTQNFSRPPHRVHAAKPGRVVGPILPYDGRAHTHNTGLLPHGISPHYMFRMSPGNREKCGTEPKDTTQVRPLPAQRNMSVEMNTNPYYQTQEKVVAQLGGQIGIDAKLLQAQTQFGAVGAAAVAVAAHREVGTVQYGLT
ncbi:Mitogen-activated protein kinase 10 [Capsicum baccatum]|uniref:mitogen-activated protein kinase n=1 Tax=Capsicum baccatum TaxID=33114 RepID=A0A2G2VRG8_CAPBA|nr:Mitogen-activated protein kinase 10 [Capsicum baccatum]